MEILLVLIGIIIAIVSAWYTYRSYRHSRKITSKGPGLKISLFFSDVTNDFYILLPFNKGKIFLIPFIFSLKNCGEVSAKNIEVFFTITSALYRSNVDKTISKIARARGIKHASEEGRTKFLTDSYTNIGDLSPNTTINLLYEFNRDSDTIIQDRVKAKLKDGANISVDFEYTYSLALEVKILHEDHEPVYREYNIQFRKSDENEKLFYFIKREEELLLRQKALSTRWKNNDNIRIVTFGTYEQLDCEVVPMNSKDKDTKFQLIRCDSNTVKYIDCIIKDRKFLFKQNNGDFRVSSFQQCNLSDDFEESLDRLAVDLGGIFLSDATAKDERTEDKKLIDDLIGKAEAAFYERDYSKVISICDSVLYIEPELATAWYNKGISLGMLGRYEETQAALEKALEIDPNFTLAWQSKGTLLATIGRHEEALADFDKALEINPNFAGTWINKGSALHKLGRPVEALTAYGKELEIQPDNSLAWYNIGVVASEIGYPAKALTAYEKALEINPYDTNVWYNKGVVLSELDRHAETLIAHEKALEINPNLEFAWVGKGTALGKLGRYEESLAACDKALEINPNLADAWGNKGAVLGLMDRPEEALTAYEKALEINPNLEFAWVGKGTALGKLGRYEESLAACDKALEINPNLADAWGNKGTSLGFLGRHEEALAAYEKALEINPGFAQARHKKIAIFVMRPWLFLKKHL